MGKEHGSRKNKTLIIPDVGKITYNDFASNTLEIRSKMYGIVENFMFVGKQLKFIKDNKLFKLGDYKSFIDYCKTEFDINKNQAYNFIKVFERFNENEKYKTFTYSSLVEMLSLSDEQVNKVPLGATVKEVREIKKKEKEKENNNSLCKNVKKNNSLIESRYVDLDVESKNIISFSVWKGINDVLDKKEKPYSIVKELVEYYCNTYIFSGKTLEDKLKEYPLL